MFCDTCCTGEIAGLAAAVAAPRPNDAEQGGQGGDQPALQLELLPRPAHCSGRSTCRTPQLLTPDLMYSLQ